MRTLLLLPLALFVACAPGSAISAADGDAANGETVYTSNCASCHGAAADGGSGPAIAGASDSSGNIDAVLNGTEGMPGFVDSLSDQDVSDIFAYLATL